jgi:two-component system NarL family response regulator
VHLFDAIAAGASGYLLKGGAMDGFVEALEGLARGESPLSPGLAAKILAEFARRAREREAAKPADPPTASLTERQNQILRQVAEGRHYKEVGRALGLTEATIKYHMGEITDRLHLENRAQAIAFASRTMSSPDFFTA